MLLAVSRSNLLYLRKEGSINGGLSLSQGVADDQDIWPQLSVACNNINVNSRDNPGLGAGPHSLDGENGCDARHSREV